MQRKKLLIERGVFHEDLEGGAWPQAELFDITEISHLDIATKLTSNWFAAEGFSTFRGSLGMARRLGRHFEFCNVLNWLPVFREKCLSNDGIFVDLKEILGFWWSYVSFFGGRSDNPKLFVRPVSPFKEFAGNAFSLEELMMERNFMVQNNQSKHLICLVGFDQSYQMDREYRCIFINGEFVSMSRYMNRCEVDIQPEYNEKAREFACAIAAHDYFLNRFDFVLDIAEYGDSFRLVEVNAFETSSFYAADLDLIYRTLAEN